MDISGEAANSIMYEDLIKLRTVDWLPISRIKVPKPAFPHGATTKGGVKICIVEKSLFYQPNTDSPIEEHSLKPHGGLIKRHSDISLTDNICLKAKYVRFSTFKCNPQDKLMIWCGCCPKLTLLNSDGQLESIRTPDPASLWIPTDSNKLYYLQEPGHPYSRLKMIQKVPWVENFVRWKPFAVPSFPSHLTAPLSMQGTYKVETPHSDHLGEVIAYSSHDSLLIVLRRSVWKHVSEGPGNCIYGLEISGLEVNRKELAWQKGIFFSTATTGDVKAACSDNGKLFIGDCTNRGIHVLDTKDGTFIESIITDGPVLGLTCNKKGDHVAAIEEVEEWNSYIWVYSRH